MTDASSTEAPDAAGCEAGGLFDGFSGFVTPTSEDWKGALGGGTVVVDTNVLLNLYRYSNDARDAFLSVFRTLGLRLWVPNQVMSEFWRNRESAIEDPRKQLDQSKNALRDDLGKATEKLRAWANRVSLDRREVGQLENRLSESFEEVIGLMEKVVDSSGLGMERDTSKDRVIAELSVLLTGKVGLPLSKADHDAAVALGKQRIAAQIPPGYMDKKKDSRGDNSEVGDYLVWHQLKLEAKRRGGDFVFVTGDFKEDWWRIRNGMPVGPRNELSEEFIGEVSGRFFMLKPEQLLLLAREHLQVEVSEVSVQNVEMVDARSELDEEEVVGSWNYILLADLIRSLRIQAPVQEAAIFRAVDNGGFVSRDEIYELGGYEPGRMLKGFTRPIARISQDVALNVGLSRFDVEVIHPVYDEMKAGFGRVDGFQVSPVLLNSLMKARTILEREADEA
ncbi:PIN-like domain-containing protein [Streptomyces sp. XY413]|uniref:PIN-like domain-containing protein n=1 Tax=Streptomyces sp. XY413 TaxID=1519479 RepID=UPI000B03CB32|nr:PIN domain-containing protein [Streptomyces sp. XY413]